jgi:hypothetical protein
MKTTLTLLAVLVPLLCLGCEKTIHEVESPLPMPGAATMLLR